MPHYLSSSETTHIPLRRFAVHALLSALAVTIPQLLYYFAGEYLKHAILFLSWNATHTCGFLIYIILSLRNFDINIKYSIVLSHLIASLHVITIILGKYVGDSNSGFITPQHIAVHFCLVFYVITESEFYRAYANFQKFDTYTSAFKHLQLANTDSSFTYCRDPFCYMLELPNSCGCYSNGNNDSRTFWAIAFNKPYWVFFASCLLFHMVGGLANYIIKQMVNPGSRYDLLSAIMNGLVLFGSYQSSYWELLLGLALLRSVRQANYVGFWAVVELVKRWRGRSEMVDVEGKNELEIGHERCRKCGQHL